MTGGRRRRSRSLHRSVRNSHNTQHDEHNNHPRLDRQTQRSVPFDGRNSAAAGVIPESVAGTRECCRLLQPNVNAWAEAGKMRSRKRNPGDGPCVKQAKKERAWNGKQHAGLAVLDGLCCVGAS